MNNTKSNIFARSMVFILIAFIGYLIITSFNNSDPKYQITSGIIILLCLMLILALGEIFDSFSVGTLISLKKNLDVKEKEVLKATSENKEIKNENNNLRSQLMQFQASLHQRQTNNTIHAGNLDVSELAKLIKVVNQSEEEKKSKQEIELEETKLTSSLLTNDQIPTKERKDEVPFGFMMEYIEHTGIEHYRKSLGFSSDIVKLDMKINDAILALDPISNIVLGSRFDGYIESDTEEIFIEVTGIRAESFVGIHMRLRERFYLQLSRLRIYSEFKNKKVKLVLVVMKDEECDEEKFIKSLESTKRVYEPSVKSGLLDIVTYEYSMKDIERKYLLSRNKTHN